MKREEKEKERTLSLSASSKLLEEEQTAVELTELEKELQQEQQIELLHQQDTLLQQVMVFLKVRLIRENLLVSSAPFLPVFRWRALSLGLTRSCSCCASRRCVWTST